MEEAVRELIERERVAAVVNTLFTATDRRDWAQVRGCFGELVTFDMTSLAGGTVQQLSPDAIASGWEVGLKALDAVHHQTGNMTVTISGSGADVSCYGTAYHYRPTKSGRNTRTFVGSYDFHLVHADGEWRIDLFRFLLKFVDGNLELEKEDRA